MKPMNRFMILLAQIIEPFEVMMIGGSHMAWVRRVGEWNHEMGHDLLRLGLDPEDGLMGCRIPQVEEWIEKWGPDLRRRVW